MRYAVKFVYQGETLTRETSWIHLEHLVSWITNQPGYELLTVELIEGEEHE